MSKKATIAIPVYKRLDYLIDALRSVAMQDYPNIELFQTTVRMGAKSKTWPIHITLDPTGSDRTRERCRFPPIIIS